MCRYRCEVQRGVCIIGKTDHMSRIRPQVVNGVLPFLNFMTSTQTSTPILRPRIVTIKITGRVIQALRVVRANLVSQDYGRIVHILVGFSTLH